MRIGRQLRAAEAQVPAGMWERIQSEIAVGAPETGVSNGAWWIGGLAAVALMGSMVWVGQSPDNSLTANENVQHVVIKSTSERTESSASTSAFDDARASTQSTAANASQEMASTESTGQGPTQNQTPTSATVLPTAVENSTESSQETTAPEASLQNDTPQSERTVNLPVRVSQPSVLGSADSSVDEPLESTETSAENENTAEEAKRLEVVIQADHTTGYAPFTANLSAKGTADAYHWDLGAGGVVYGDQAKVTFEEAGVYTVYLIGSNSSGDVRSKPLTIEVKEGSNLVVPDSFSPNGDGINDTYAVSGVGLRTFHLFITDSKGKVLFETQDMAMHWNPQADNHPVLGEYYRVNVQAVGVDGKRYSVSKPLHIIR